MPLINTRGQSFKPRRSFRSTRYGTAAGAHGLATNTESNRFGYRPVETTFRIDIKRHILSNVSSLLLPIRFAPSTSNNVALLKINSVFSDSFNVHVYVRLKCIVDDR